MTRALEIAAAGAHSAIESLFPETGLSDVWFLLLQDPARRAGKECHSLAGHLQALLCEETGQMGESKIYPPLLLPTPDSIKGIVQIEANVFWKTHVGSKKEWINEWDRMHMEIVVEVTG